MTAREFIKAVGYGHYLVSSDQQEFFMEEDGEHTVYVVLSHPVAGDIDFTIDTTNWRISDD